MTKLPKIMSPRETWPAWECMPREELAKLMQYQWDEYGYNLELEKKVYKKIEVLDDIESSEELTKIMQQRPRYPKGVDVDH